MDTNDWEDRLAGLWADIDEYDEGDFVTTMQALVAERSTSDPIGLFELAGSYDSTGRTDLAVPLYREALAGGLDADRRRRAVIQLASSLRNLGHADESVALLTGEAEAGSDELDDAVAGFLALALADVGREREALSIALGALAPHLPRYSRSLTTYARLLTEPR
ncbi:MAG: tetratricopeptide repeat protein [Mycetocola sp.]